MSNLSEEKIKTRIYNLIQFSRLGALRDENFKEEYKKDEQALERFIRPIPKRKRKE